MYGRTVIMFPATINLNSLTQRSHINYTQAPTTQVSQQWERLAELSYQDQWILFTAQCQRPSMRYLAQLNTCCNKVIHMKPSSYQSEFEIAIKAIQSGNASAVVVSHHIDEFAQRQLKLLAKQHQCEVFFTTDPSRLLH